MEFQEKIKKVNELLKENEPKNWTKDHKGYAGYKPQWVIDSVNSQFSGQWSLEIIKTDVFNSSRENKNGKPIQEAFVQLTVTIEGGGKMSAMASHPILDDFGDAMKSAQTDAMKKALAHYSIGNRAYHGLLK